MKRNIYLDIDGVLRGCTSPKEGIEELYERIANWIYYYDHERTHTILLMPPAEYAKQLQPTSQAQASLGMDKVSRKMGV